MGCIASESTIIIPLAQPYPSATPIYQSQNQQQNQYQNKQTYPNQEQYPQYQQPYQAQPKYSNKDNPQGQAIWQNPQQAYGVNQSYQQKKINNSNTINNSQFSNLQVVHNKAQNITQKQKSAQIPKNPEYSPIVEKNDKKQKSKNPSNPNLLNTDQVLQPSTPDHNQFLTQLQRFISSTPQLTALLTKDFFTFLFTQYSTQSWSTDSKEQFITILLNYIKFTSSQISQSQKNETKYQLKNFGQRFGKDLYKLFNSIKMKNFWVIQTLTFEETYKKIFLQSENQQILKLVNQVKHLCANNTQALVYLSHYLMKFCLILEKLNTPPSKINQILKSRVVILKQMFSPKNTLEQQLKFNNRSFEKDQLSKIPSMDVPYKKKIFAFKTQNKEEELNDFIMEIVEMGKKHFSTFTKLTSHCCLENEGFGYKSNLKLKQRSQTMQLLRVKEKLLGNFINQYYKNKTYDCKSISELRTAEIAYLEESLKNVYSKMDQVEFIVTDILRGKCMFNKVSHINTAAQAIMKTVEERASRGQNIQVVSIDNRLMKITTDLMLRIRIDEIVCEFQIALKFNQAENQIHHKMYEVERSKAFSPVTMLFNWHQSISNEFFVSVDKVLQKYSKKEKKKLNSLVVDLKKKMQYKTEIKEKVVGKISKKDWDYLNRIKTQIKNMKNPPELSNNIYMRTGICLKQMKKYNEAIDALFKHKQKQPRDINLLSEIGSVYNKQAQYRKADQYLLEYITATEKLPKEAIDINRYHKGVIDYVQANFQIGKNNKALQFLMAHLQDFKTKYFGEKSKEYAKIICLTARGYIRVGKQNQSKSLYEQAIALFEKAEGKDEDPNYPQCIRLLAQLYIARQDPSIGLQYLNKALSLSQGMFGKESIESATILMTMGTAYQKIGQLEIAQEYLRKYAIITENLMTKESMEYVTACFYFSSLYSKMDKYEQALECLQICRQLTQNLTGNKSHQYVQILSCQANIYLKLGKKPEERLKLYFEALEISTALCKQEKLKFTNLMAILYSNIASSYRIEEDYQRSFLYLGKNIQAIEYVSGPQSLPFAESLDTLINQLVTFEKYEEALPFLERVISIYKKNKTENQAYFTDLLYQALCLCKSGSVEQSMESYVKLSEIVKAKDGENSVKYANVLISMYTCFAHLWGIAEKKQLLAEVLKIYEYHKHPQTKDIKMAIQNLQNQENGEENDGDQDEDGQ